MRYCTCLLFFIFFFTTARATHIVGGEILYQCLGNDNYQITLTVYRDCYNGAPGAPFDPVASIGIFDVNWKLIKDLRINFIKDDTLPVVLSNPCLALPPNVCVHRSSYSVVTKLPFKAGGYHLAYQRCCRNQLIRNIPNPLTVGATYYAFIGETAMEECNTSARFNNWPPVAICANEPIDFDHSASDKDGDSLVYRLCTPLEGANQITPQPQPPNQGPYQPVTWFAPVYSLANVLGGQPLKIDAKTGFLTGIPNTLGNFVVGICVDEYRNGQWLSTTRRDFQYNVADCGVPLAAFFVPEVICNTLSVRFDNQSRKATNYLWQFGSGNATATTASPVFTYLDTGRYTIRLTANPGTPCANTFQQLIYIKKTTLAAEFQANFPNCSGNVATLQLSDISTAPGIGLQSRQWLVTGPGGFLANSTLANPNFTITQPGDYTARLIAIGIDGCRDTLTLKIAAPIPPFLTLQDSVQICRGDDIPLFPKADPKFIYQWSPPDGLSNATSPNPTASPVATTRYQVTVKDANLAGCSRTGNILVSVKTPDAMTVTALPDTILAGGTAQLQALLPGGSQFNWSPSDDLNNALIPNPKATPKATTLYTVTATDAKGCPVTGTVNLFVPRVNCEEPYLFFPTGFSPNQDDANDRLKLESSIFLESVYWVIYNRWGEKVFEADDLADEWDGTFKGENLPEEAYGYYLRVQCPGEQVFVKKGNVTLFR